MSTPIPNSRKLAEDIVHAVEGCTCFDCRDKAEEIIAIALMAEREACAKIADSWGNTAMSLGQIEAESMADDIASAIRDRSKT